MAHKLESTVKSISALSVLTVVSPSETPSIKLYFEEHRSLQGNEWKTDPSKSKQVVEFMGEDGGVQFNGIVDEADAVEIGAAYKVVLEISLETQSLPAFQAGRKSKTLVAVGVSRVLEVWADSKKCLWKAQNAGGKPAGREFDSSTGKIGAAA